LIVKDLILRFLIGGLLVSAFAVLGDVLRPRSFAGLFGAAPSVALATLGMTVFYQGKLYAASEGRAMIVGAVAFLIYAWCFTQIIMRWKQSVQVVSTSLIAVWLTCALGAWWLWLR
jgi:hypothetical protein